MSDPGRRLARSPLWQLTRARIVLFLREPEALFWVFAFPVLMAVALGIAFRSQGPKTSRIGVEEGPLAAAVVRSLETSEDIEVVTIPAGETDVALRRGRVEVVVRPRTDEAPLILYDPTRPETRVAWFTARDALERAAGREDLLEVESDTRVQPGSRYIDFLIPGLIGLNLLGTGMWGVGFAVAQARQQKLLKRLVATPMRRGHFLLSFMFARMTWLVLEVGTVLAFGWIAFGVQMRGSWPGFVLVCVIGALAFAAMGLLVASRSRTIEGVSGLMNVVMLPMWLLSGVFFSAERFPDFALPFIRALPLTAVNDALRQLGNEGAGIVAILPELAVVAAWGGVAFAAAIRLFRWE